MNRILVPVDFSPTSQMAFRYAVDIASRLNGSVILYHLFTPGKKSTIGEAENIKDYNEQKEKISLKRLQRLKKKVLSDNAEVPVSTLVGRIPVTDNILGFAEHNQIDLIVMGTQGASGLKKIIVGSVASKVMEKSNIPVLLIPEKFQWKLPENIVFTTSFNSADTRALPIVFEIAKLYRALVTFVNLLDPADQHYETEQKKIELYAYSIQRIFNDSPIQFHQMKTDSVIKTMKSLYDEIPYDMLIMARRKLTVWDRAFQKSFTKDMACITTQPLLVIPGE